MLLTLSLEVLMDSNCENTLININSFKFKLKSILFSWWISGWLFLRCSVWMPRRWLSQIMKSSNYWRPFFVRTITTTTFITTWICRGTVLLTRGLISPKFRIFLTAPPSTFLRPGLLVQTTQFPFQKPKKPRFIHYTYVKLYLKVLLFQNRPYTARNNLSKPHFLICVFRKSSV